MLDIARIFGIVDAEEEAAVRELPVRIRDMVAELGIPPTLAGFGIAREQLPGLLRDALQVTRLASAFPVPDVPGAYARIIERAFEGSFLRDRHGTEVA